MPIRAIVNNEQVVAPDLTDEEWGQLKVDLKKKVKSLVMHCCGVPGHPRISKLGNKHFAHNRRGDCDWPTESKEHILAKTEIYIACQQAGIEAIPEFVGPDWIADVYIPRENRNIAIEIQWSTQSLEKTLERQERYEKDNVRGIWFFQKVPKDYVSTVEAPAGIRLNNEQLIRLQSHNDLKKLPLFQLELTEEQEFVVNLYGRKIPLKEFVPALINRKMKICRVARSVPKVPIEIVFSPMECWRCGNVQHCYFVEVDYHSTCGLRWGGGSAFDPAVINLVRSYQQTDEGKALKIGEIKERNSKTQKRSYMSFGCPECDAIVGNRFLDEVRAEYVYDRDKATAVLKTEIELDDESRVIPYYHACYPDGDAFCDGKSVHL